MPSTPLLGRDLLLAHARAALRPTAGLLLTGPEAIGRSAVLDLLADEAAAAGRLVLRCAPAPAERALPYAALIDLCRTIPAQALDALPAQLGRALRGALLRTAAPADPADTLAVHHALVAVLRQLTARTPVLLVLDGLQDLDRPSAAALAHLARRADEIPLTLAAAERTGHPGESARHRDLTARHAVEMPLPPLGDEAVRQLLAPSALPVATLRRVTALAAGHPGYALELARHHRATRAEPATELPARLLDAVLADADGLPPDTVRALLLCAQAHRPTLALLLAAGVADPVGALAEPDRRGLLRLAPDGRIGLRHPLLGAALRDAAGHADALAAHAALAEAHSAAADAVERAHHLALARPWADRQVAEALTRAADTARRRGDADTAWELAALAADRTPRSDPALRHARLLTAASRAAEAARHDEARAAAAVVLAESDHPGRRVRARLVLLDTAGQALGETGRLIEGGLADAGSDPSLLAPLRLWSAVRELLGGRTGAAAEQARLAAALATAAADRSTRVDALGLLATVQALRGRPHPAAHALATAIRLARPRQSATLLRRQALSELDADRVGAARRAINALLVRTDDIAGVEGRMATLVALTRIQARAGECRLALETAADCTRLLTGAGTSSPPGVYAAALAETVGGDPERAVALAQTAVAGSTADGDLLFRIRALGVLGDAYLLTGGAENAARATEALQRARELGTAMELADPDQVRRLADLAEGLLLLGEPGEAAGVLRQGADLVGRWPAQWGDGARAALDRTAALHLAATGHPDEAMALLASVVERLRALPLPLELARTLVARGTVERRARHRSASRDTLAEAEELCLAHGAVPLLRQAQRERRRLSPGERAGHAAELTPSESRMAGLVAAGATNREIAAALFVSVKTVEGTLSRVYRKLGVRSRTALVQLVPTLEGGQDAGRDAGRDTDGHTAFTGTARVTPLIGGAAAS